MNKKIILLPTFFLLFIDNVMAHCPLCTIGAAAVAGGAAWYGVENTVIGVFIGGFAVSMGWWFSNIIKKQYIPYQKWILIGSSFFLTIIPIMPMMSSVYPFYVSLFGDYGSLFNRTYIINRFLVGSFFGGVIVSVTPTLSNKITNVRGKIIPFQGIMLTLISLIIVGGIIQILN